MGIYIYTLRKASKPIIDNDGNKSKVNFLSYAYKLYNSWTPIPAYDRMTAKYHALADKAYNDYDGGYVVIVDAKTDGKATNLDGHNVYSNLYKSDWTDCDDIPMDYVGYLKKVGKSYHLVKAVHKYHTDTDVIKAEIHNHHIDKNVKYLAYVVIDNATGKKAKTFLSPDDSAKYLNADNIALAIYNDNKKELANA